MPGQRPWRRQDALESLLRCWRHSLVGRQIIRVTAGSGWLSLSVAGRERTLLYLLARPGAVLLWDASDVLPSPMRACLGWIKRPPLASFLTDRLLDGAGMLPGDRVMALSFSSPPGEGRLTLLHQLFGTRGNVTLLDEEGRLLWSLRRPIHTLLTQLPPEAVFGDAGGPAGSIEPADCADVRGRFRTQALAELTGQLETENLARLGKTLRNEERAAQRLIGNLSRDLAEADRGEEYRRLAETLAASLNLVPRGSEEVELPSPFDGRPVRIPLDPALEPAANLDHYFRLARKAERGRDQIAGRLESARTRLAFCQARKEELAALAGLAENRLAALLDWQQENAELLRPAPWTAPGRQPQAVEPGRPFRRYLVEGKWEVWVGRNNAENDELTHHRAAPEDIWFHAQAVTGSHVILRTGGKPELIPGRVLAKAAALAALHSKARHSSLVPVVYTRRKYVRKPRKSPPGTATCIREKSLFAEPGVPPGVAPA